MLRLSTLQTFSYRLWPLDAYSAPFNVLQLREEWETKNEEQRQAMADVTGGMVMVEDRAGDDASRFVAYVPLPDSQAIE